ncbi:MAG TPA: Hsp20/alpha crystallin family protein [Galbitalea sp.]|jgi:HSP20 family protein|nr:Hsp20/alpha crystallin family protein [Galbitalea sp.]
MSVLYKMPIDLYRDGDHYTLNADLPGIDPSSVNLDVDGQFLTIRAERVAPSAEGRAWLARENRSGSFVRRLTLGDSVDREHISASYDAGVLSVTIPVAEKAKPRKIEINTGSSKPATSARKSATKLAA